MLAVGEAEVPERLNVYLPDDLHRALEAHREHLNVSRICQEALAREVARLEGSSAMLAGGPLPTLAEADRGGVVSRLRAERERRRQFWHDLGYRVAFEWGRDRAGPAELEAIAGGAVLHMETFVGPDSKPRTGPQGGAKGPGDFQFHFSMRPVSRETNHAWRELRDAARAAAGAIPDAPQEDLAAFNAGVRDGAQAVWEAVAAEMQADGTEE
jgi:predicted transcriptional regulator